MKDKKVFLGVIFLLALGLSGSCEKEKDVPIVEGRIMEFRAIWADGDETRTILQPDGTSVWWSIDDAISVFYGNQYSGRFSSTNTEPQARVNFKGELKVQTGTQEETVSNQFYWAVYPYSAANQCDGESVVLSVPSSQDAISESFNKKHFPAVSKSRGVELAFYNVCGGARFSVANEAIHQVVFKSMDGEPLSGKVRVAFGSDGKPFVKDVLEGADSVVVESPDGGFIPGKYYYVSLLPQTLARGMRMTFRKEKEHASLVMNGSISINRSRFGKLDRKDESLSFEQGGGSGPIPWDRIIPNDLVEVHNPSKGRLEDVLLEWGDYTKIQSLKITGTMNDVDFLIIYRDMPNLRYLDISEINNPTLPAKAFYKSTNVTRLILPGNLTEIGESLFEGSKLEAVKIGSDVEKIGLAAFRNCSNLSSITFEKRICLITMGESVFSGCKSLKTIEIPPTVKRIGKAAFSGCTSLCSLSIPVSVETIEQNTFMDCTSLTDVSFESNAQLKAIYGGEENKGAFYGCSSLRAIEIPASVEVIGQSAFRGCTSLTEVFFEKGSKLQIIEGGVYMTTYKYEDYGVPHYYGAFYGCTSLRSIEIPASVESIGQTAFAGCVSLKTVSFEKGSQLKEISGGYSSYKTTCAFLGAFYGCSALTAIEIPASIECIGQTAFKGCTSLATVTFEDNSGLTRIDGGCYYYSGHRFGLGAFYGCSALTAIEIPASVKIIGESAFAECTALTKVLFEKDSQLESIEGTAVTGYNTTVDYFGAFTNCVSLTSIKIPAGLVTLETATFSGCSSLQKVSFEEGSMLTTIGDIDTDYCSPFYRCIKLKTVDASYCSQLKKIYNNVFRIGTLRLFYCGATTPPVISESTFAGIDPYAVLKVPDNCVDAYKASTYWMKAFPQISGFSE